MAEIYDAHWRCGISGVNGVNNIVWHLPWILHNVMFLVETSIRTEVEHG